MEMPRPGPAQEKLKVFVGEWRGWEKMSPSQWLPEGGVREASVSNRLALDGMAVVQDYAQADGGKTVYRGHAVILKASYKDNYEIHWFDAFAPSLFEGAFDGAKGVFASKSPMGFSRATYEFAGSTYSFRMEGSQDGESWAPMLEGEYRRT